MLCIYCCVFTKENGTWIVSEHFDMQKEAEKMLWQDEGIKPTKKY